MTYASAGLVLLGKENLSEILLEVSLWGNPTGIDRTHLQQIPSNSNLLYSAGGVGWRRAEEVSML